MRPIIVMRFASSSLSGGYKRFYEVLKRGKSVGIDYIIITDLESCKNAVKIFPDFLNILKQYKVFKLNFKNHRITIPVLKQLDWYKRMFSLAFFISKVARKEDADLIVSPSEWTFGVLACYFASKFCSRPWTAIFQPTSDLLQPTYFLSPLNPFNILRHVDSKISAHSQSLISKFGFCIDLLSLLKIAEKTTILAVSDSVVEDFYFLNPRIKFITIDPGNGIEVDKFPKELTANFNYHGVFFARLVPEKGFFDLVEIWRRVVEELPYAKLAVCGIVEEEKTVESFLKQISECGLNNNIEFLGQQNEIKLFNIIASSYLTVYPSYLDSFSLVTIESLACGTPVIAYDIPAIRHVFGRCKAVFRVPVGDKLSMAKMALRVLTKMDRRFLSKEAKKFSASFNWGNVVKAEKEAYSKVINLHKHRTCM
jgi:glycosyltransferase involved in cell wall biosynthesis